MNQTQSFWRRLWIPSRRKWLLGIPVGGFAAMAVGAVMLSTFHGAINATNANAFCYSCHIGMDTIVEEYQQSIHFNNETGVQAQCADCHVPKEFFPKMLVKIRATKDIYHQLKGTVTLENFEQLRVHQAEVVYNTMKNRDSNECKNCHNPEQWNTDMQSIRARNHHDPAAWLENNETCVDCHLGVAHKKPAIY
ncbi:NapC/NirT family cytochrome c [Gynuella sp.]|uniref:NapC/NirT family cytochrome c n=1 Tax=Gynuella sp. TaxID=2969146 RepID=UPI003D11B757